MDSVGRFHMKEVDGKTNLVYSLVTFSNKPAMDSGETDGLFSHTLFLCPNARIQSASRKVTGERTVRFLKIDSSPQFQQIESADDYKRLDHHVLPLFWCNDQQKEDWPYLCAACKEASKVSSDFYFCGKCDEKYHKECVESPLEINHPLHPKHPLQLLLTWFNPRCFHCKKTATNLVYHCTLCRFSMHPICAVEPVFGVIEQCKRHDHPLTYFTRKQVSLDCNVCGLTSDQPTYVCLPCNFVAHGDCADSPHVIRISRHHHRVSFALSLPPGNNSCGVCRTEVSREYGGYTCTKECEDYVVHSRCALRKDIWDGEELEGVPEEDDFEQVVEPFKRISDGVILHFLHKHHLRFETSRIYDESKICEACVIPIYEGDFYSCGKCDFILHDTCANALTRKRHHLHPHPLRLKVTNGNSQYGHYNCSACGRLSSGFFYVCKTKGCRFNLDVRCASISEPYDYQGHEHPLFLALDPAEETKSCQICQYSYKQTLLNCIECDYIICFECVTLPYKARYKHDKHFLTLGYDGDGTSKPDWCEVCEKQLPSEGHPKERSFYTCNHCCTTLHTKCLLGKRNDRYMKPGHTFNMDGSKRTACKILLNNSLTRPTCDFCKSRCDGKIIVRRHKKTCCSLDHFYRSLR